MAKSTRAGYKVEIRKKSCDLFIVADLSEQFQTQVSSSFESRSSASGSGGGGAVKDFLSSFFNPSFMAKSMTHAVWKGTEPIQFSLNLLFDAESNTFEDVHRHLVDLQSIVLPRSTEAGALGDILYPPNPSLAANAVGYVVQGASASPTSIRIGRQWFFPSVVIRGASATSDTRLNNDLPIAGAIELQIATSTVYSEADLRKAAGMGVRGDGE